MELASQYNLPVIEDAAQAIYSNYKNRPLGSFGDLATVSFHETKNITCGEGGCLLVNNKSYIHKAEILREKGTNRSRFLRGQVDKYTWVSLGSSYLPGEVSAAFLCAQLEQGLHITEKRLTNWHAYDKFFSSHDVSLLGRAMHVPEFSQHNAHMYYLICPNIDVRSNFITYMRSRGIGCVFHYVPLHSSPAGLKYGRVHASMQNTDKAGSCLVRLPMGPDIDVSAVIHEIGNFI